MHSHKPKFSIICTCYNHERYVSDAINSVLNQSEQDFELIIVDDCSSDNSVNEIKKNKDSRIKLIQNEFNKGVNFSINTAYSVSIGRFVAFISSDDMLMSSYLSEILNIFYQNPNIVAAYCNMKFIDENNNEIKELLTIEQQTRLEILRKSFLLQNQLSSPGMVVRKCILKTIMPLDLSFVQYQDYAWHIKLLLLGDVFITDKRLVMYRRFSDLSNLSAKTPQTRLKAILETDKLMDIYTHIKDTSLIKKIFEEELNKLQIELYPDTIEYCLANIAMLSSQYERQAWGYKKIMHLIDNESYYNLLHSVYGFDFKTFLSLLKKIKNNDLEHMKNHGKAKKYKRLFNISLVILGILFTYIIFNI